MMPVATSLARGSRKLSMKRPLLPANRPSRAGLDSKDGQFVSLLDPPEQFQEAGVACHGAGAWPVPIGGAGQRESAPAPPIILPSCGGAA